MAAKKRKASNRQPSTKRNDSAFRSKFGADETFDNSDDEFIAGRDQILLDEGPEAKRRRKLEEEDALLQPSDEEVLGYGDEDELDEDDEDEGEYQHTSKSRRGGLDSDSEASANGEEDDEEGLETWGSSRKDYYNADNIETEADALEEENEAKRLQQKHLKAMKEADFGFDEIDWLESVQGVDDSQDTTDGVVTEVLPQLEITDDMSTEERLKVLKSRYPEFEFLAKDFVELQPEYASVLAEAQKAEEAISGSETSLPISIIKFRALASYLGSISMYFALLTSPAEDSDGKTVALSPAELRDHPIMGSLVKCRKQWETVKDWSSPDIFNAEENIEADDSDISDEPEIVVQEKPTKEKKLAKLSQKEKKSSKLQQAAEAARAEAEARRVEKIKKAEAKLVDLADLVTKSSKNSKSLPKQISQSHQDDDDSDIGDEGALTVREAEEKAQKKRSLRFYTSQIAQKANKRSAAGRNAGGDEDLPYRERLKDRQARLNAEAERRGRAQANPAEQLGGESDEDDHRTAREVRGDDAGTDDDEYYDMVAARNKQKKAVKKTRSELAEAAQQGGYEEIEEIGPDGKRRITYQIEKNKGLMAKRNKDVRNPRVKKRKRFEQKKKKLGSIRQVYKGGEGREGYGGELTGIKKNLVKSVKL